MLEIYEPVEIIAKLRPETFIQQIPHLGRSVAGILYLRGDGTRLIERVALAVVDLALGFRHGSSRGPSACDPAPCNTTLCRLAAMPAVQ
jgi:hypothetical protein